MENLFVIGDIHGGLRGLTEVMEKANVTPDDDLIFLGDYVDGWSDSAAVIDHLIRLQKQQNCVFIKGNHDTWCQQWLSSGVKDETWLGHGGESTIESYSNFSEEEKQIHKHFFEQMPFYHVDDENRLFIHAGFTSMGGPKKQKDPEHYTNDRTLWETALALDPGLPVDSLYYPRRFKLFKEIYIGHTPTLNFDECKPMNGGNVWNIDTGAAFKGSLSIINADTKQVWQSEPLFQLYPNEKGRNKN